MKSANESDYEHVWIEIFGQEWLLRYRTEFINLPSNQTGSTIDLLRVFDHDSVELLSDKAVGLWMPYEQMIVLCSKHHDGRS